jgi:anti-anti-sigma factor
LDFISSAGIRVFLMAQKELKSRGGTVMMMNPQPQIRKVFDIIKALPDATVFSSVEELDDYLAHMQDQHRE